MRPLRFLWVVALVSACVPDGASKERTNLDVPFDPNDPNDPNNPNKPNDPNDPNNPSRCEELGPPVTPRLRRLTFQQYDRTVSDLVGLEVTPSTGLGPEVEGVNGVLWDGIELAAADVAAQAMADADARAALIPCQPADDGSDCARMFVVEFGLRAFRRPLLDAEIERYTALYADRAMLTENGTFEEGIQLILEAFLQSPNFLLRVEQSATETDGKILLSGYELATRLSYALWNGPPDSALLEAAEAGVLDTTEGVRTEAARMLTDDARTQPLVRAHHRDWLGMVGAYGQFWSNTNRDPALFPEFYSGIDVDFREEVLRFIEHVVLEQEGGLATLLTSEVAMVNERTAPIYGLSGDFTDEWVPVALDPETRPGLLTRAGFLGTHGRYGRGSLIFRGAFVLKRMLCTELGNPPPGAESTPLPDLEGLVTTRERIEAMTAQVPCSNCHTNQINPAGFAFEYFDGVGKHRTEENGAPIDGTGSILLDGVRQSYDGPKSYADLLAASNKASECYVERFAEFTFADSSVDLGCAGRSLAQELRLSDTSIKDFLVSFVASEQFRSRAVEEEE